MLLIWLDQYEETCRIFAVWTPFIMFVDSEKLQKSFLLIQETPLALSIQ
jgi:hypothetical protein